MISRESVWGLNKLWLQWWKWAKDKHSNRAHGAHSLPTLNYRVISLVWEICLLPIFVCCCLGRDENTLFEIILWRLRRYLFEKSSITPIYSSFLLCTCKLPTPSKCKLLLWVCSNLLLILLCCVAKLAQNWFMKENTKQLALCFCLRPDHSTLLQLFNALQFSRLSVVNMACLIHLFANFAPKTVGGVAGVLFSAMMTISVAF